MKVNKKFYLIFYCFVVWLSQSLAKSVSKFNAKFCLYTGKYRSEKAHISRYFTHCESIKFYKILNANLEMVIRFIWLLHSILSISTIQRRQNSKLHDKNIFYFFLWTSTYLFFPHLSPFKDPYPSISVSFTSLWGEISVSSKQGHKNVTPGAQLEGGIGRPPLP